MASSSSPAGAGPNPMDYFTIQNTIARYCVALDTKNFDLLRDVFTDDVDADYPFNHELKGCDAVAAAIKGRLTHITSQHAVTTQLIDVAAGGKTATATTYFTGVHFGKGRWHGHEVTAWGKYVDELELCVGKGQAGGVAGGSGQWLISRRHVVFMARLGEEGVMEGE